MQFFSWGNNFGSDPVGLQDSFLSFAENSPQGFRGRNIALTEKRVDDGNFPLEVS